MADSPASSRHVEEAVPLALRLVAAVEGGDFTIGHELDEIDDWIFAPEVALDPAEASRRLRAVGFVLAKVAHEFQHHFEAATGIPKGDLLHQIDQAFGTWIAERRADG